MGAVFIYNKEKLASPKKAMEFFSECEFTSPMEISVGEWTIFAFPKLSSKKPNVVSEQDVTLVSVGTPLYKGKSCIDSLWALLWDSIQERICYEELKGCYTLFFCRGKEIHILCDPLGSKHLFIDTEHSMISSSMLAITQCTSTKLHVDKEAVYEKFLTGFIMTPKTIFEEIKQIDDEVKQSINRENRGIRFMNFPKCKKQFTTLTCLSRNQCVNEQVNELLGYFDQLKEEAKDGIDLGLSGGYDSRLALACANHSCHATLHLHSHATENDHDKELTIARKMADYIEITCHVIPTRRLSHSDDVSQVLRKSVLYYDGRTSFSIGGCGEIYTADYRKASTEECAMTLTGVGGELYRNVFCIGRKTIRFDKFLLMKVFNNAFRCALPAEQYQALCDDITIRAAQRLGITTHCRIPKSYAHRYYCEVMMPDGQGNALDAYNQVSYCVAPFLEPNIIRKGYEGIPFHGTGGDFEASVTEVINAGLAALPSIYGYSLSKRPVKYQVKEFIRAFLPGALWEKMSVLLKTSTSKTAHMYQEMIAACEQSNALKEAIADLYAMFPEIDFSKLYQDSDSVKRMMFIAMTIYFTKERITQDV